ncbi:MAG: DUF2726 domain-containing protein [Pseudomonadota bacterium]
MQTWFIIALGISVALIALVAALLQARAEKLARKPGGIIARPPLNAAEQSMYARLVSVFPPSSYVVLAQVSLTALLEGKTLAARSAFAGKCADFVLLNKGMTVMAIIGLDDTSRKGKEDEDIARDVMLMDAGYKVIRYASLPQPVRLLADMRGSIDGVPTTLGGAGTD